MIVYYDAFLASLIAGGYFTYKILQAGVYNEQKINRKENVSGWGTFAASCIAFGLFISFIIFPMEEDLGATLDSFSSKLLLGLMLAALFGFGMILVGKLFEWFGKKSANQLTDSV